MIHVMIIFSVCYYIAVSSGTAVPTSGYTLLIGSDASAPIFFPRLDGRYEPLHIFMGNNGFAASQTYFAFIRGDYCVMIVIPQPLGPWTSTSNTFMTNSHSVKVIILRRTSLRGA